MQLPVAPRAAFQHRDFRLHLAAQFLANVGTQMLSVAVGWQVYAVTHRPLDLGYLGLVQFVPAFGFSPLAGHLADRLDRARIVAVCDLALAACALALFAISGRGVAGVAPIYPVLFLVGVARAFSAPAGQSLVPGLVPAEHFPNAVTWGSTVWQISTIVGPSLGGLLYGAAHGATWVYAACGGALGLASLLDFAIRPRPVAATAEGVTWNTFLAGFRYVRAHRVVLGSISLDLFAVLLGGATALLPVYASDILRIGPAGLGLLRSGPAVGAAVMAAVLAYRPLTRRAGPTMLACVALFGAATIVFGLSRSFALSFLALLVLGASDIVSVVVRSTVVQLRTPHEMRGRVSAVNMMFIVGSSELGEMVGPHRRPPGDGARGGAGRPRHPGRGRALLVLLPRAARDRSPRPGGLDRAARRRVMWPPSWRAMASARESGC
jgi:MFS family permease